MPPAISRVRIGRVPLDAVTLPQAIDRIVELATSGNGGTVYTPNVDHIVVADEDPAFTNAYSTVSLSLTDGTPVFWAARLFGFDVPEKVSGSDLFEPLVERAAELNLPVYLLGGAPGVAELARDNLMKRYDGLKVVGLSSPRLDADGVAENEEALLADIDATKPAIVFVACGAPKSELFSHRHRLRLRPAVLVCVGAAIDFAAGTAQRAPAWMSKAGLEWAYRLAKEPRRLAHRYLVRDPRFLWILARQASAAFSGERQVPESRVLERVERAAPVSVEVVHDVPTTSGAVSRPAQSGEVEMPGAAEADDRSRTA